MATVKNMKQFLGVAGRGIKRNAFTEEGKERLFANAISGIAWGGGIGGTLEMAQGGSFWEGAKTGAFRGAVIGAGGTMVGNAARGFKPNTYGFKESKDVLSKQLKAVMQLNRDNAKHI